MQKRSLCFFRHEDGYLVTIENYTAHVGDSRAYLIRDNKIAQLTSDHTVVAWLV